MRATITPMDDAVRLAAVRMLLQLISGTTAERRLEPPSVDPGAIRGARTLEDLCVALDCSRDEAIAIVVRAAAT